jgi:hypothetical protein
MSADTDTETDKDMDMETDTEMGMDILRFGRQISDLGKKCNPIFDIMSDSSAGYRRFRYQAHSDIVHHGYWTACPPLASGNISGIKYDLSKYNWSIVATQKIHYCSLLPHQRIHEIKRTYLASCTHGLFIT